MSARSAAIIIGAGVAGSTCAILLAEAGWNVTLVEKQTFPRRKVCGECVSASNLGLLDALGVGAAFAAIAGAPLRRVAWCAGDAMIQAPLPPLAGDGHAWGRALGREHLDTLLLDRARELGATVLQPCTARSADQHGGRHGCTIVDAEGGTQRIEADVLIDAHGSWQRGPLADQETSRRKRPGDLFAFKANFSSARLPEGLLPVLAFAGGYGGMVQGDHGLLTLACCIRRDRLHACRQQHADIAAGEAVQKLLQQEIRAVRETLQGARREGLWLAVGPIRPRICNARRSAGSFSVGNAAGEAHPILGEGISMAMQSAFLLCDRLLGRTSTSSDYAATWRRAFAGRMRWAALYAHIAMHPLANRAVLPLLKRWPRLLSISARLGGKVRCVVDASKPGRGMCAVSRDV
jgi:2-polyprenyl-6-methoxyphenol hydroxylase-like FAD-dependent oxidoreductase